MNQRLRSFIRGLLRLALLGLGLGALLLGWRAFLHYGPRADGAHAMYLFHAKALVRHRLTFPRPAAPVFLPAPQSMSSAEVQLRLMKWWDGKTWLPDALARGEAVKGGLRLYAGELVLGEVTQVTPPDAKDGTTTCKVRVKVRWNLPEELRELVRVKEIVALRFAKGPGETAELTCTFTETGWRWELIAVESPWVGKLPVARRNRSLLDWLI